MQNGPSQSGDHSIYSRFGLGDPVPNSVSHMRNMGNINAIYHDLYHINISNPASYSWLRTVAFDMGMFGSSTRISDGNTSQVVESGNLDYLSIAFPLSNVVNEILEREERNYSLSMAFAVVPFTRVGYNISTLERNEINGDIERVFLGTGGTYRFMWGNSIRYKTVSAGINLGYVFGNIEYERNLIFDPEFYAYNNVFTTRYNIKGFNWTGGLQFSPVLRKAATQDGAGARRIHIGIYGGSNTSFSTRANITELGVQQFGRQVNVDTLFAAFGLQGTGTLPGEWGAGVGYQAGEKWLIGINYEKTFWSNYKNELNPDQLTDAYKWSVGGYYRPDWTSPTHFWKRIYYRYGLFYSKDPSLENSASLESRGLTFGMGMPFIHQRKISHLSIGFELGTRGRNGPIQEDYLRVNIGFTFNDNEWFLKRRFD